MSSVIANLFSHHVRKCAYDYLKTRSTSTSLPLPALWQQSGFRSSNISLSRRNLFQPHKFISSFRVIGLSGLGLGLLTWMRPVTRCESTPPPPTPPQSSAQAFPSPPPPLESTVSYYELSFGTIAGICAGVFIKKGAKAVAFFLGGIFVLLQYLNSSSLARADWQRMGKRFESLFYTTDATGSKKAPTVYSAWRWLVDFLTADFQLRASFIASLLLGLRIG